MPGYIKISLVDPCEEDISGMSATACGRHCEKCNKEVIDFTGMTDVELIDWMRRMPVACGTFNSAQLNRYLSLPQEQPYRSSVAFKVFLVSLFTLFVSKANAQRKVITADTHEVERSKDIFPMIPVPTKTVQDMDLCGGTSQQKAGAEVVIGGGRYKAEYIIDDFQPQAIEPRTGFFKWIANLFR